LNVGVITASPASFDLAVNKDIVSVLAPGETANLLMAAPISIAQFEGTTQTFSITVQGTNEYTGETITVSDEVDLVFSADPSGSLDVSIVSPAP